MEYVHLHVHSHYSLLDGVPKINDLIAAAKTKGFSALALTDHGCLYGAIEFYNACKDAGIKPIIGVEAYIAPRTMHDKEGKIDSDYFHITLLAASNEGYKNLLKLVTLAHTQGFYYKPRIDLNILKQYSNGLICLSGCQRGEIARMGEAALQKYLDIFGQENFFIEIQRNSRAYDPREVKLNEKLIDIAKRHNLRLVATADCHYIKPGDSEAQDILLCIGTGKTVNDTDRMDMRGYDLSLKSADFMQEQFKDVPEALSNTVKIAERCNVQIKTNQRYFPQVTLPPNKTADEYLKDLTYERAVAIYGRNNQLPPEVKERIDYELAIIIKTGFVTYFLMVADVVDGAHKLGAVTNTRGSAAGSIVGRILGITNVDPLYYELPFERFLTEHRPTPPDIDLDIADNRRDEAIHYITKKFGKDKVAQIITFGTMMARAAIRDVGRALGVPYNKCDKIAKMVPFGKQGFHMTLDRALEINEALRDAYDKDPETKQILDVARKLEGNARHASIHAAGVVITPTELTDYMPLQLEPDGDRVITQYDMYSLDVNANSKALGVVKLDLLGIRNLSILEASVKIAQKRHGVEIDIYNLPHPDKKTFKLLSDGHTFGVFQMGSSGMTRYLKELKPNSIFDIMAMIALYRPGPLQFIPEYIRRKHNQKLISYMDPALEKILKRTYGILVYQDDLLTIAHDLAGYSWEELDIFRYAVGKKIPAEMAKQKEKFIKGCMETSGWSKQKASEIWAWIEPFAAYGFNKSHSASYCVVSYQTAYMKANYPVEFMAALMTAESGDMPTIVNAVEECRQLNIEVLPPDVNESLANFTVIDEAHIRFGLNAIKNLGSDVIQSVIEHRKTGGRFTDLENFITRIQTRNFNKKSWEALVKSGALDSFGERNQLLANTETILEFFRDYAKAMEERQTSLFGNLNLAVAKLKLREVEPASEKDKLTWERELLGLYVSAHPLDEYATKLKQETHPIKQIEEARGQITIGGIISKVQKIITKKGEMMAFIDLEDLGGMIEVLVFPSVFQKCKDLLVEEKIVLIPGKVSDKDGVPKFLADDVRLIDSTAQKTPSSVTIKIPDNASEELFVELKKLFEFFPGELSVNLLIKDQKIKTPFRISLTEKLKKSIIELTEP